MIGFNKPSPLNQLQSLLLRLSPDATTVTFDRDFVVRLADYGDALERKAENLQAGGSNMCDHIDALEAERDSLEEEVKTLRTLWASTARAS